MNWTKLGLIAAVAMPLTCSQVALAQSDVPANFDAIVEASKSEGSVLVYANLPEKTWGPFRELLSNTYPWIELETTDMGAELWEKYFAESAAGTRTADIITTTAPDRFADFIDRGELLAYTSSELASLPEWSRPEPGLYTLSASPGIIMYNRFQVDNPPKSLADIAALVLANPDAYEGKVSTYDAAANPFGTAMFATWLEGEGNDWETLDIIGAAARPETGGGTQREKTATGEYNVSFFLNGVSVPPLETPEMKQLIGWNYIADGTPISLQGVGITKAAASPNSAKVVLDLMLSREGQIAFAQGGLTPYRDDIANDEVPYDTLQAVRDQVGDENLIFYSYDRAKVAAWPEVVERWKKAFK